MFTQLWCRTKFSLSALSANNGSQTAKTVRDATMETYVPSLKQLLVAVSCKRLCQYITTDLSAVHEFFIVEYDSDSVELEQPAVNGEL